ncbi:uncharacterized protein B0H18DRAFT_866745 [Fomitopsis serialis]|uniref:uncharacterized protein n=1 Tax=Fomitopsis serialis TaxID=139415 RepID=UPI0020083966|nr:uncharacterized protein B0H18DRAFT_866745 [Neoantrodia serialis]KAH9938707.1 hypothetical protein B0H18DRAFT_866745 [Neoantrodia serialis]
MSSPKVWFITGSSTGFGRVMTELVLAKGDIAVATLRSPEVLAELASQYGKDRLLVLKLDVCKPQEIKDAFAAAVKQFGRVDNVFNNAAYAMISEAETGPEDIARTMFDVNLWGAINVSKEAVRIMREVNKPAGGRLLQISSMSGYMGMTGMSYYCATKHAINAFTEALSKELDPDWNIKVVIVEPGAFRTGAYGNVVRIPLHPAYEKVMTAPRKYFEEDVLGVMQDPVQGVEVLYKIAELPNPPLFLPLGKDSVSMAKTRYAEMVESTNAVASWSEELRVMG